MENFLKKSNSDSGSGLDPTIKSTGDKSTGDCKNSLRGYMCEHCYGLYSSEDYLEHVSNCPQITK